MGEEIRKWLVILRSVIVLRCIPLLLVRILTEK
jgi:hypothetical protein